ncbi:MAG: radical SAM protein [Bacteroidales bacterium]|jgi:radical SAM superfamily enzyme YgiQ (UPF0313 family)
MTLKKKNFKLLLINPVSKRGAALMLSKNSIYPPMALGIIAALTPPNWEVIILDENFTPFEYQDADLVGFTSLTSTINRCYEIAAEYRKNKIPTIIGGIHVSMLPQEAIKYVDAVVVGEAEDIWEQVILDFEKNRLKQMYVSKLLSMQHSVSPRTDLYHPDYTFGSVQTSRGCPMKCEFCSVHTFNGSKYRLRPVEHAVKEFIETDKDYIYLVDDNFAGYSTTANKHALDFFKGIVDKGVSKSWGGSASMNVAKQDELLKYAAASGCKMIFLGIESELIEQIEKSHKKINLQIGVDHYAEVYQAIHQHSIAVMGAFIYGLDNDTPDTIYHRTSYILNSDIDIMQATILTPLPGTITYQKFKDEGRLLYTNYPQDWDRYNFIEPVFQPQKMSVAEFSEAAFLNWERLYNLKTIKRKFLNTIKLTKEKDVAMFAFSSNLQFHNFLNTFSGHSKKDILSLDQLI